MSFELLRVKPSLYSRNIHTRSQIHLNLHGFICMRLSGAGCRPEERCSYHPGEWKHEDSEVCLCNLVFWASVKQSWTNAVPPAKTVSHWDILLTCRSSRSRSVGTSFHLKPVPQVPPACGPHRVLGAKASLPLGLKLLPLKVPLTYLRFTISTMRV